MRKINITMLTLVIVQVLLVGCNAQQSKSQIYGDEYNVAAYVWPCCHHDERFGDMLWPDGTGEWEVIKKGTPRFEGPFLESSLNNGFLKAKNNEKMQFYVMWANHDVRRNLLNVHKYPDDRTLLWRGAVDLENFKTIVARVIKQYFTKPNYFKIDGKFEFSREV